MDLFYKRIVKFSNSKKRFEIISTSVIIICTRKNAEIFTVFLKNY